MPTTTLQSSSDYKGNRLDFQAFGGVGDGTTDNASNLNRASATVATVGGGSLFVARGTYLTKSSVALGVGQTLRGDGTASLIQRNAASDMATNKGVLDIPASSTDIIVEHLAIDGGVTTPTQVAYTNPSFHPNDAPFVKNSTLWVHGGGTKRITFRHMTIRHTGGFAGFIDATTGTIEDIVFDDVTFEDCRPFTFTAGSWQPSADLAYGAVGSWIGGLLFLGDGDNYGIKNITVRNCRFARCAGNNIWVFSNWANGSLPPSVVHQNVNITDNWFEDNALDGIEIGCASGGVVSRNHGRRSGYLSLTDGAVGTPRQFPSGDWAATFLDHSGWVSGISESENDCISVNGGAVNLDGLGKSGVVDNTFRIPLVGDPEYVIDSIATMGPGNSGVNLSVGIATSNSNNLALPGDGLDISRNRIYNFGGMSLGLFAIRNSRATDNILAPPANNNPPVVLANIGSGPYQRVYNNIVSGNQIKWYPSSVMAAIQEQANGFAFQPGDKNWIVANPATGNCTEFLKDANTDSSMGLTLSDSTGKLFYSAKTASVPAAQTGTVAHWVGSPGQHTRVLLDAFGTGYVGVGDYRAARGTAASPTAVQAGDKIASPLQAWAYGATGYSASARASISAYATENWTDSSQGTQLEFCTTPIGSIVPEQSMLLDGDLLQAKRVAASAPLLTGYTTTASALAGTTTTNVCIISHGLVTGDMVLNSTRNALSAVTYVDANNFTTSSIAGQTTGDSIRLYSKNSQASTLSVPHGSSDDPILDLVPMGGLWIQSPLVPTTRNFASGLLIETCGASPDKGRGAFIYNHGSSDAIYAHNLCGGVSFASEIADSATPSGNSYGLDFQVDSPTSIGAYLYSMPSAGGPRLLWLDQRSTVAGTAAELITLSGNAAHIACQVVNSGGNVGALARRIVNSAGTIIWQESAEIPAIEFGAIGAWSSPTLDWHSSATPNDYDVRMIATGGDAGVGNGALSFIGRYIAINTLYPAATFDVTGLGTALGDIGLTGSLLLRTLGQYVKFKDVGGTLRNVIGMANDGSGNTDLYVDNTLGQNIYFRPGQSCNVIVGPDGTHAGGLYPNGTNLISLGASSYRWLKGWMSALDVSGAVTGSNWSWDANNQVLNVTGKTGTAGVNVLTSYVYSQQGFNSDSYASNAVNVVNGGVTCLYTVALQSMNLQQLGTAPGVSSSGYAAVIALTDGHLYYSHNGGAYVQLDGGSAGVSSLNSLTGGLSIAGTPSQIGVSATGSTITLSTPQNIATTSAVTFAGILDSGGGIQSNKSSGYAFYSPNTYSQFHGVVSDLGLNNLSIQSASGIACGYDTSSGFFVKTDPAGPHGGAVLKVINGYDDGISHQEGYFSGPGVNIGAGPVTAGSFNIWDGSSFFGGESGTLVGTFTWNGAPATTIVVKGGAVVKVT